MGQPFSLSGRPKEQMTFKMEQENGVKAWHGSWEAAVAGSGMQLPGTSPSQPAVPSPRYSEHPALPTGALTRHLPYPRVKTLLFPCLSDRKRLFTWYSLIRF